MAEKLSEAGIKVSLCTDAVFFDRPLAADLVVVGADAILPAVYVNKVGTNLLQEKTLGGKVPFVVLADSSKFLPAGLYKFLRVEESKPPKEVWPYPPVGVDVTNQYFQLIPLDRSIQLLSERGAVTPKQLRGWLNRVPVAKRWRAEAMGDR